MKLNGNQNTAHKFNSNVNIVTRKIHIYSCQSGGFSPLIEQTFNLQKEPVTSFKLKCTNNQTGSIHGYRMTLKD